MNIRSILEYGGYHILEEEILEKSDSIYLEWAYIYKVKYSEKKLAEMQGEETVFNSDIYGIYILNITRIGLNGHGDIYLEFGVKQGTDQWEDIIEIKK